MKTIKTSISLIVLLTILVFFTGCDKKDEVSTEPVFESYVSFEMIGKEWVIDILDTDSFYNITSSIGNNVDEGNIFSDSIEFTFSTIFNVDTVTTMNFNRQALFFEFYFKVPKNSVEVYSGENMINPEHLVHLFRTYQINVNADPSNRQNNRVKIDYYNWDEDFWLMTESYEVNQSGSSFIVNNVTEITEGKFTGSIIIEGTFQFNLWGTEIGADYGSATYWVENGVYKMLIRNKKSDEMRDMIN